MAGEADALLKKLEDDPLLKRELMAGKYFALAVKYTKSKSSDNQKKAAKYFRTLSDKYGDTKAGKKALSLLESTAGNE